MAIIAIIISFLNALICIRGIKIAYKNSSLLLIWWLYFLYFTILFILKFFTLKVHYLEWTNSSVNISDMTKLQSILFNFITNISFYIGTILVKPRQLNKNLLTNSINKHVINAFLVLGVGSFVLLLLKLKTWDYITLVTSEDFGGFSFVFVQVFMSIVVYAYLTKKWFWIFVTILLSLLYIYYTSVRSILSYSIFTLLYLYVYSLYSNNRSLKHIIRKITIPLAIIGFVASLLILLRPAGSFLFPEEYLVDINYVVFNQKFDYLLFNSYEKFIIGFLNPLKNLLEIKIDWPITAAEFNSGVFMQTGDKLFNPDFVYHFPGLFYNELYVSFGWIGSLGGIFYSLYFLTLENFVKKSNLRLFLFLPIFSWHTYMIFRGAIDISSVGIAYSLWVLIFVYLLITKYKL